MANNQKIPDWQETKTPESPKSKAVFQWIEWLPLAIFPLLSLTVLHRLPPWVFMWLLAFAIFAGLKWASWWKIRPSSPAGGWHNAAYLLAWPGMDAKPFLKPFSSIPRPGLRAWLLAIFQSVAGGIVLWTVARRIPVGQPLLRGWIGMLGIILLLHFGTFKLLALFWQTLGIDAKPIMNSPLRATSLGEFWGKRWNLGFRQLAYDLVFTRLHKRIGGAATAFLVFVLSGLIHDLVISVPSRGGYGLPTAYFVVQGIGSAVERSAFGKRLGIRNGVRGWLFTMVCAAGPAFLLFHPWFVQSVILPFMEAIRAL